MVVTVKCIINQQREPYNCVSMLATVAAQIVKVGHIAIYFSMKY